MNLIEVILAQGSWFEWLGRYWVAAAALATLLCARLAVKGPPTMFVCRTQPFFKHSTTGVAVFWTLNATHSIAFAQSEPVQVLEPLTIRAGASDSEFFPTAGVPLGAAPMSVQAIDAAQIRQLGAKRLADLIKLDAGVSDAYNTSGYWDYATVRGFVLDNRSNYRREGMPISAETSIALFNKQRVDVLKGTSGLQSGVSAPGGLVSYAVKRPVANLRSAELRTDGLGGRSVSVDLSDRFGASAEYGLRANVAIERLGAAARDAQGSGQHAALAGNWRLNGNTQLDAEWERSQRSQRSVPGQSLWGNALPPVDARNNLNAQSWSLPVELAGSTASLRLRHTLPQGWQLQAQWGQQQLSSNARVIFPFGCSDANGNYYADRYCPRGDADFYDYRSDNERRSSRTLQLQASGSVQLGSWQHRISLQAQRNRVQERYQDQAYNYVATGSSAAPGVFAPDPAVTSPNTNRDESSRELAVSDTLAIGSGTLWLGVRHSQIERSSVRTDGSRASQYSQGFSSPWLAWSQALGAGTHLYASRSSGIETDVAPNRSRYTNGGQSFSNRSWQTELGIKHASAQTQWHAALFHIERPVLADLGTCTASQDCTRAPDGNAVHTGLELQAQTRIASAAARWRLGAGAAFIHATRQGSALANTNGLAPTNVPQHSLRAQVSATPTAWAAWQLDATVLREGQRQVLPDNSVQLPAHTRLDVVARWQHSSALSWQLALDNATNTRAWRESPYQFGHSYLFALQPRTWRAAALLNF